MTIYISRLLVTMFGACLAVGTLALQAAKAPVGPEDLKKQSSHIVSGKVLSVTSKEQRSTVEKAAGIHRDRVYTITVLVNEVAKGAGVKAGEEITVVAWQPAKRIPPLPGPQGHETIPKKGDRVTFFLTGKKGASFAPIMPNGIAIDQGV